jgi:hypothetical protein
LLALAVSLAHGSAIAQTSTPGMTSGYKQAGVTVKPPSGSGWKLAKATEDETRFERSSPTEVAVARSRTLEASIFGEGGDLLARMERWKEAELSGGGARRDSIHFNRIRFKRLSCLQYDGIFVVDSGMGGSKHSNVKGYLCPLPDNAQSVVELEVSNRTAQRGFSEEFAAISDDFFDSATFASGK